MNKTLITSNKLEVAVNDVFVTVLEKGMKCELLVEGFTDDEGNIRTKKITGYKIGSNQIRIDIIDKI